MYLSHLEFDYRLTAASRSSLINSQQFPFKHTESKSRSAFVKFIMFVESTLCHAYMHNAGVRTHDPDSVGWQEVYEIKKYFKEWNSISMLGSNR